MRLVDKMKARETLTPSENQISQYILKNTYEVVNMSLEELAGTLYVSKSTISRFCKKLGFKGHKELSVQLAKELMTFYEDEKEYDCSILFGAQDDRRMIAEKVYSVKLRALSEIASEISLDQIHRVAKMIYESKSFRIFSSDEQKWVAYDLYYRLGKLGIHSQVSCGREECLRAAAAADAEELVLFLVYDASQENLVEMIETLIRKKSRIVMITGSLRIFGKRYADEFIQIPQLEAYPNISLFGANCAFSGITDLLYAYIFSFDYAKNMNSAKMQAELLRQTTEIQEKQ